MTDFTFYSCTRTQQEFQMCFFPIKKHRSWPRSLIKFHQKSFLYYYLVLLVLYMGHGTCFPCGELKLSSSLHFSRRRREGKWSEGGCHCNSLPKHFPRYFQTSVDPFLLTVRITAYFSEILFSLSPCRNQPNFERNNFSQPFCFKSLSLGPVCVRRGLTVLKVLTALLWLKMIHVHISRLVLQIATCCPPSSPFASSSRGLTGTRVQSVHGQAETL